MRFLIRVDGDASIGGGHVMRCLTLAHEAKRRGHQIAFVTANSPGNMSDRLESVGFRVFKIAPGRKDSLTDQDPDHAKWLSTSWWRDAERTAEVAHDIKPDWIVWDHYGLDARWVNAVRSKNPYAKFLAIDDLDDREVASELALDQTRITQTHRVNRSDATLTGPTFALLRPEFRQARNATLASREGSIRRILIAPGMVDGSGLAPLALKALDAFPDVNTEVVMGSASQSVTEVEELLKTRPNGNLTLDSIDMATLMSQADLCIGAGGMTSWERCCLGLPTIAIRTAENQRAVLDGLDRAGAVISLSLEQANDPKQMQAALTRAFSSNMVMAEASSALCDGLGTARVMDALEADLRPMREEDAKKLFDWRNQPHIRQASLSTSELVWENHLEWIGKTLANGMGLWKIYSEGGRDLGHVNALPSRVDGKSNSWIWGFYIGERDAPRGAGRRMLSFFLRELFSRPDVDSITAEVRADNKASISLHEGFGFQQIDSGDPQVLAFTLDRCNVKLAGGLSAA